MAEDFDNHRRASSFTNSQISWWQVAALIIHPLSKWQLEIILCWRNDMQVLPLRIVTTNRMLARESRLTSRLQTSFPVCRKIATARLMFQLCCESCVTITEKHQRG